MDFLKMKKLQWFVLFRYTDDAFFIWTHRKEELESFMKQLNSLSDHMEFRCGSNKENFNFPKGHLLTNIYVKPADCY